MSEINEEALRRLAFIRLLKLASAGNVSCPVCGQAAELFIKRQSPSGDAKPHCLDCWKAER